MSVVGQAGISIRPWRGYDDPGLPVGAYVAQGSSTGDASGGDNEVRFVFAPGGNPVSGRLWSIEQMAFLAITGTGSQGFIEAFNFDSLDPSGLLINRQWALNIRGVRIGNSGLDARDSHLLPLFLGMTQPVAALESRVSLGKPNFNTEVITATIQGFIWEARSVMAEGGLRRPVDTLYGR